MDISTSTEAVMAAYQQITEESADFMSLLINCYKNEVTSAVGGKYGAEVDKSGRGNSKRKKRRINGRRVNNLRTMNLSRITRIRLCSTIPLGFQLKNLTSFSKFWR